MSNNLQMYENIELEVNFEVHTQKEADLSAFKTVSSKIRFLSSIGKSRAEIAKMLNIRYQHVRNVLTSELKK